MGQRGCAAISATIPNRPMPASAQVRVTPSMPVAACQGDERQHPAQEARPEQRELRLIGLGQPGCVVEGQQYQDGPGRGQDDSQRHEERAAGADVEVVGRLADSGARDERGRGGSHGRLTIPPR